MMTFYAAIGTYRIRTENGHKVPYIQKLGNHVCNCQSGGALSQ